jgi:hypothetical protein
MRKATSANVTVKVRKHIILRHGYPETIITDDGRKFVSLHFGDFLIDCGIRYCKTPPHCNAT